MSHTAPSPGTRRFERSRDDRVLGGVCAGLARLLDVDPLIVRAAAVVLAAFGGLGVLAYLVCVLIVPEQGQADPLLRRGVDGQDRGLVIGLVVLTVAVWGATTGGFLGFGWGHGWLLLALALVAVLLLRRGRGGDHDGPGPVAAQPPAGAPGAPAFAASTPDPAAPGDEEPTLVAEEPAMPPPAPAPRSRGGRVAAGAVLLVVGIAGGVLALAGADLRWDEVLAVVVIAAGVALIVAAPFGGARGLIPLAAVVALATGVAAAANLDLRGGVGRREYRPGTIADLRSDYHLAAGQAVLDLRDLQLPPGDTRTKVDVGFGQVTVRLPRGAGVAIHAHAAAGDVRVLGEEDNGLDAERTLAPHGVTPGVTPVLHLDARVGFGQVRIVRAGQPLPRHAFHDGSSTILAGGWR